ncbi:MAG: NAD(P)/FAD-dependent oxidoreductase [Dehalococcoidia bacterium]|nr:NAD(P)/FAD-dependent oxidoreductase [Dehalococcoidia bacterium]
MTISEVHLNVRENRYDYDAVVVGAGPAGSTAAAEIAQGGFRVLLLEEHAEIGVPLHCSGLVTPRTLDEAGVGQDLVLNHVVGAHVYAPSGRTLSLGDGQTRALVIDRVGLDRALVARAQERGAELVTRARVIGVEHDGAGIKVRVDRQDASTVVRARLLVGADGANSRVAHLLGMDGPAEVVHALGAEGTLPGAEEQHVQVFVGKSVAPGWFAWTIPLGNGRVRLGVGTSNGVKPVECLRHMLETYPAQLKGWQATRWTGGTIPLWSRRKIVQDNVMLVGDAAGQVKPTSGGGIYPSLVSAKLAAGVARTALAQDDLTERKLRQYSSAWDKTFGKEYRRGQDLRRVYTTMDDQDFDRLLALFGSKRLLEMVNRYGDIDFPGRLFQRLTKLAPALWLFVRGPLRYAPLWK